MEENADEIVVVKVYAGFCRACKAFDRKYRALALDYEEAGANIKFFEMDWMQTRDLCKSLQVRVVWLIDRGPDWCRACMSGNFFLGRFFPQWLLYDTVVSRSEAFSGGKLFQLPLGISRGRIFLSVVNLCALDPGLSVGRSLSRKGP
ncbi:unnamed protein product, partial [Laminaria digitata]